MRHIFLGKGHLAEEAGKHYDSERPEIALHIVRLFPQDFRRNVTRRSAQVGKGAIGAQRFRKAEVYDLGLLRLIGVANNVLALEVAVGNVLAVHVFETAQHCRHDFHCEGLVDCAVLLDEFHEREAGAVLHDDIYAVRLLKTLFELHQIGVIHLAHDIYLNLCVDQILLCQLFPSAKWLASQSPYFLMDLSANSFLSARRLTR